MAKPREKALFDLYDRMDRLEELIEDMAELNIKSRDEAEQAIIEIDRQIDELESRGSVDPGH